MDQVDRNTGKLVPKAGKSSLVYRTLTLQSSVSISISIKLQHCCPDPVWRQERLGNFWCATPTFGVLITVSKGAAFPLDTNKTFLSKFKTGKHQASLIWLCLRAKGLLTSGICYLEPDISAIIVWPLHWVGLPTCRHPEWLLLPLSKLPFPPYSLYLSYINKKTEVIS